MKLLQWDKHRDSPPPDVRGDLEMMRRFQQQHIPFVISIWWLPERFYTDAYEQPRSAHNRLIKPDKWEELLDLIGSYLLYAKREYSVEPDLFSFNESNIGIYVALTPETHLEAIKRIGAHFRKLGLKTRMLLGDATGPRDTHKFVLEAASDPEALQYVGAVAFHSWGGGTPEQYAAWGDVAEWLHLPLLVTEMGVDAAAYHNRAYTSYHYGLEEAKMTQELLTYARPQGTQFWQFTNDYGLARVQDNAVQPTARFYLVKHFTDLTPPHSDALARNVGSAGRCFTPRFAKGEIYTLHILNMGSVREAALSGLPDAQWRSGRNYRSLAVSTEGCASIRFRQPAPDIARQIPGHPDDRPITASTHPRATDDRFLSSVVCNVCVAAVFPMVSADAFYRRFGPPVPNPLRYVLSIETRRRYPIAQRSVCIKFCSLVVLRKI